MPEITEEELEKLPFRKVEEAFANCIGNVEYCPECGNLTAFLAAARMGGVSECHVCDYTKQW